MRSVTSGGQIACHFGGNPGNYEVTVELGGSTASDGYVEAESYRRMLGEVMRILTVADDQGQKHYPRTLFQQAEAQSGVCTARGVIYTAGIAAGLMLHQFCRYLRGQPIDCDLALNLLASELAMCDPA